jgi:hypothetical protein
VIERGDHCARRPRDVAQDAGARLQLRGSIGLHRSASSLGRPG